MFDMMRDMQRFGLQAMSVYHPLVSAFLDSANATGLGTGAASFGVPRGRPSELRGSHDTNEEQVIGVGEEVLNVGTRMIPGKTTRVRRIVVQAPVQQDVTLHTETVVLERRKPILSSSDDMLTEVTVEMSDFNEVPVVSKTVHLVEEVLLRKEVTARTQTIRDTVRRDTLEIEQPSNLPAVIVADPQPEQKKREESTGEIHDKKQPVNAPPAGNKAADQKRP
jgi:stress response protein YsnF